MITFIVILIFLAVVGLSVLFYFLHERVEKMSQNQGLMLVNQETLRENQEALLGDIKKVIHDFKELEKEVKRK